ncbi:Indole-3-pyruvate decarboxylase [Planctomycetes bacterium Pan216]|uniref:Indole-3-pyruvate decarboxylase n=1 Tax=Kolteria novifilia TaxID=2527975 RepID=A0A518BB68_9BACT|nr:Indole-3-pyruvate decarboxylase [Planctomycetes bacterium Pan216]
MSRAEAAGTRKGRRGSTPSSKKRAKTISQHLIGRLEGLGLRHVFGIPGDYVLGFYEELCASSIDVIGTTREDCAGYAADAYARVAGLGALCVTYCVGGLSVVNSVAQAYAEKSPLLVISGSPGMNERGRNALLHHKVRDFETQRDIFEKITVAGAVLHDPLTAFRDTDRVIDAILRYKRPGYLELPRDLVGMTPLFDHETASEKPTSDQAELTEAVEEAGRRLGQSKSPAILVGVEIHRFGLQDDVIAFAEKHKLPMASTLLGKSVVPENHPLYVGVYEGALGKETPRQVVEDSDCLLMLGTFITDINLGIDTANLDPRHCLVATSEDLRISHHHYHSVLLEDFVGALSERKMTIAAPKLPERAKAEASPFTPEPDTAVSVRRLFEKIDSILSEEMVVICDVGDALFAGGDLTVRKRTEFLSPAYYTSMGFAIPAALGAKAADPDCRPIVIVGDGAFQMTGTELSTIFRLGQNPIVFVLNNKGYTTERFIKDGSFNDIGNWNYHRITELIGGGWGFDVRTEKDLEKSVSAALANRDSFSLLNIHLDPYDRSDALERVARRLGARLGVVPPEDGANE